MLRLCSAQVWRTIFSGVTSDALSDDERQAAEQRHLCRKEISLYNKEVQHTEIKKQP